ncbi:hypothetical protein [Novibacillus thermophilus]|uniref:hypothetical protein n=1 Tax=Novibacillus thermophilus TaxID=1471761 RepID=UPI001474BDF4|nr:hypothetical protein [Novibacillus thermophilus]
MRAAEWNVKREDALISMAAPQTVLLSHSLTMANSLGVQEEDTCLPYRRVYLRQMRSVHSILQRR